MLLNNTSELALSFNNVIFFKILIKNQDKYEPKTAIAITDHFLKLGMSPRHTRTRQEIIEWPSLGKFDTYICNNCDGKTHPVCQHLQQKEVQKKTNDNTQKKLEYWTNLQQKVSERNAKRKAKKEKKQTKSDAAIQNLLNKAKKNQPKNPTS